MLSAQKVNDIFMDCLFKNGEDTTNHIAVKGIQINVGFNPEKIKTHRKEIASLLNDLPDEFNEGWSFLNAAIDKNGHHWGEHKDMEQLFLLGMAIEKVKECFPRDMWSSLPGGMPYYITS